MTIDTSKLKDSTKRLIGAFIAFGSFMQIPAVNKFVLKITEHHPNLIAIVTSVGMICTLLHDPRVQEFFGYSDKSSEEQK